MTARAHPASPRRRRQRSRAPTVIKLGGELLEEPRRLRRIARALTDVAAREPVVVVHGGGRDVDREVGRLGLAKRAVDGLRITDAPTLEVVVGVLAGRVNTRLVAVLCAVGARALGLTGADTGVVSVRRAARYRATDGFAVDLGFVGLPQGDGPPTLLRDLVRARYLPVVASIAADARGRLYNVNADTMAGDLASRLRADTLIVAGATAGVLNEAGHTIPALDDDALLALIRERHANAGMVAKLHACRAARGAGVKRVMIVDGRRSAFATGQGPGVTVVR